MKVEELIENLSHMNVSFFTGVPDSQLKPFCDYLMDAYGISNSHIIAANEGNATAIAAGYHLATGKIPCVYLQNSGLGNIINPMASLLNDKVYAIPCIFIIGWRGEPGLKDEPQHIYQGQITKEQLKTMGIATMVLAAETDEKEVAKNLEEFNLLLEAGKCVAILVRKGALSYDSKVIYKNDNNITREEILRHITAMSNKDIIVSTTGKTSRELFEIREQEGKSHKYDFLTVGSMGHSSSIALGIALNKPNTRVWCIDGDGAALMHLGAMAIIGANAPSNFIHVLINNAAHESVGGQPTVADKINFEQIALGCGYREAFSVANIAALNKVLLKVAKGAGPILVEVKAVIGSREDLGRPTTTPVENKLAFMNYLKEWT